MKGKNIFNPDESLIIRDLLKLLRKMDREGQKSIRGKLRKIGFFISDYTDSKDGFTVSDYDLRILNGKIIIKEE